MLTSTKLTVSLWQQELEHGSFDTITCFSVTKWVHLNGGDEALQALLAKVHSLLAPGGRFILEPQQWVSYKKAVRKPVSTSAESHMYSPPQDCFCGKFPLHCRR